MSRVNRNIKRARVGLGRSQLWLAMECRVTREAVSQWERGESTPTLHHVRLAARALKTTVDELLR